MHVLIGLRAGVWCGSAHSGAPWTPPTARGMPKLCEGDRSAVLARELQGFKCADRGTGWGGNQAPTFSARM